MTHFLTMTITAINTFHILWTLQRDILA